MQESTDQFYQAATLMLVGMIFVYAFLGLLIVVIKTVIAPLGNRFPDPAAPSPRSRPTPSPTDNNKPDDSVIAAISAAISRYRNDQSNQ